MLRDIFNDVNNSSFTCDVIEKFNNKILDGEYIGLKELFKEGITKISIFDEQERENLIAAYLY